MQSYKTLNRTKINEIKKAAKIYREQNLVAVSSIVCWLVDDVFQMSSVELIGLFSTEMVQR